ncbi:MAG: NADP-dependent malic enzyme [Gammaproteobacteria bacterium]|nr:NADP-dependent malic enzyme [Gammaproteobacteria bacterium]
MKTAGKDINDAALEYHRTAPAGKLEIAATKPMETQRDLSLAYSPGVAAACRAIRDDAAAAVKLTARGNLVAVVSNGTAVLGLGDIGPLAAKPVMEGKAVLFKKFSGIDVFDIEVNESDPDKLVDIIAAIAPTFGGINLEDIKAPQCFMVEEKLRDKLSIPVFHDDQHGTAIIVATAITNGLRLVDKNLDSVKLAASGAGAAALACLDLLVNMGLRRENITVCDRSGVIYRGRGADMDSYKSRYAADTDARTLRDAIAGADIFLGLSGPRVVDRDMVKTMAGNPVILALANPDPEILPEEAMAARDDVIMATGRSDYPNQVNNVLCFPFIFRGALDVGATAINEEMKIACVRALADLAMASSSDVVARAYGGQSLTFGRDYLIPRPFDPRLITEIAPAVARAAMDSGVATRPIADFDAYRQQLSRFVFRSGFVMKPVFDRAREKPMRLAYAEGESRRVLRAARQVLDDSLARPILIGRPPVIERRIAEMGLGMRAGEDFELVNIHQDDRFRAYWSAYHELLGRSGVSTEEAKTVVRTQNTAVAALMVKLGDADAMLCGTVGRFRQHLRHVTRVIGRSPGVMQCSALTGLVLPSGTFFLCDSHVTADPGPGELAEMALLAAGEVRRFGIEPKVAFLSHSNFGGSNEKSAEKMRAAVNLLRERRPDFVFDGEMQGDCALSQEIRDIILRNSPLRGGANLFIMPNIDAAHIAASLLKALGGGVSIGPILAGIAQPAHIVTQSISVRGLVNMSALAVVQSAEGVNDK